MFMILHLPTKGKEFFPPRIEAWEQAEEALGELARLEVQLLLIEQEREAAEEKARSRADRLEARHKGLAAGLERFCRERPGEFERRGRGGRRSRLLVFGRIGFRHSVGVTVADEARAVRRLEGTGAGDRFLRRRTELDREALRRFLLRSSPGNHSRARAHNRLACGLGRELGKAGIRLEARELWFCEPRPGAAERWG